MSPDNKVPIHQKYYFYWSIYEMQANLFHVLTEEINIALSKINKSHNFLLLNALCNYIVYVYKFSFSLNAEF